MVKLRRLKPLYPRAAFLSVVCGVSVVVLMLVLSPYGYHLPQNPYAWGSMKWFNWGLLNN